MQGSLAGVQWHAVSVTGRRPHCACACRVKVHHLFGGAFVVCDGLGGHGDGDKAAQAAAAALGDFSMRQGDLPSIARGAMEAGQQAVREQQRTGAPDMMSTAVGLWVQQRRAVVAHVGDSRAYLWRVGQGLTQLTQDHGRGHIVARALGGYNEGFSTPDVQELDLQPGDVLALTTDGVHDTLKPEEIAAVLCDVSTSAALHLSVLEAAYALVARADAAESRDNLTALVVQVV